MIRALEFENFKGLSKVRLELGHITLFIGPNGTGKSSSAQALLALKQSLGTTSLVLKGQCIDLGDFADVLHKGGNATTIGLGLTVECRSYPLLDINQGGLFTYNASFNPGVVRWDVAVKAGEGNVISARTDETGMLIQPTQFVKQFAGGKLTVQFAYTGWVGQPLRVGSLSADPGVSQRDRFLANVNELLNSVRTVLADTYYIPPVRGFEQSQYLLQDAAQVNIGPGQNMLLASTFAYAGKEVERTVSSQTEFITGSVVAPRLVPGRLVKVESYVVPDGIPLIDDGFGTNQLVQLLLTLAITPKGSTIAIDEPEIHLHPNAQARLCKILLDIANTQEKQLIVTTHSEQILYRFAQAVRDGKLTREQLSIYDFAEKNAPPQRVEQDESGDLSAWGNHFFFVPNDV